MKEEFEFTEGKNGVPLLAIVNREQLLHLALEVINSDCEEEYKEISAGITHWYILNDIAKEKDSFTEDDITDRFNELVTNHILNEMVQKGLLEENIPEEGKEPTFKLTEAGIHLSNQLFGENDGKH